MIFWFYTAVSAYLSSPSEERAGRLMVSGNVSRMMGGLAILLGIIVAALTGYLGENCLNFHNRFNICKTYYNMQHRKDGNFVMVKLDEGEYIIKSLKRCPP